MYRYLALLALVSLSTFSIAADAVVVNLAKATSHVRLADGRQGVGGLLVMSRDIGDVRHWTLRNTTSQPLAIKEVILFDLEHGLPPDTALHGESYNMFGGVVGTLEKMVDLDGLTDRGHYRLPEEPGLRSVYGMLQLTPPGGPTTLFGFSSCRRFVGQFRVGTTRLQAAVNTENQVLKPGESWELEETMVLSGAPAHEQLERLATQLNQVHPRLTWPKLPTGWCSWYCFGPGVTAANIRENLAAFKANLPGAIRYIQIDDGYQPWMGDWLETNDRFKEGLPGLLREIRTAGFEPAIWVAPFIASPESRVFREHPEWFILDDQGRPLRSDRVTFGGWRQGPWYMLDGTHPGAQQHLEKVFRTMRGWGITYFKLDANIWGALPFGRRHDPSATSVEAYRRGMAAVRRGAGDALLMGCNHALWPSLGVIHAARSSMDVDRSWAGWSRVARENLLRNWQNNRLWWNDPDCLLFDPKAPTNEQMFHLTATYATGGMLLSGDDASKYSAAQWNLFRKAVANPGVPATFEDATLQTGTIQQGDRVLGVLLNWGDTPVRRSLTLPGASRVSDFWTGEDLGVHTGAFVLDPMPGRSGRLLLLAPASGTR